MTFLWLICGALVLGLTACGSRDTTLHHPPKPMADVPLDRLGEKWWRERHEERIQAAERKDAEILFIGDSITHYFEEAEGAAIWHERYAPRKAFNLGFSGDATDHVLWRLDHGELDALNPRAVVLLIGTNNIGRGDDPADIARGVGAILRHLREKLPEAPVLLLGIFPGGLQATHPWRTQGAKANKQIKDLANDDTVLFADIGSIFTMEDGALNADLMRDNVHLTEAGYRAWADALDPLLESMLTPTSRP